MLLFDVNGQTLKRTDHFNPATDSVEYLKAKFTFNDSAWSGKTKTALFRTGTAVYKSVLGTDGACKVPSEVLQGGEGRVSRIHGDVVHVSLIGEYNAIRITTNEVAVKLNRSGYADAQTPANPTESEYQQMTAVAADAVAEAEEARNACENARADLVGVKNLFANAVKGYLSGAVVFADDVSPVEHNPAVRVHGKNLFDTSKIAVQANTDNIYISAVGEGYIDITTKEAYDGNGHCVTWIKLKELCPQMQAGKQYALSGTTTAWNKMIYLKEIDLFWSYGSRLVVTEEMLECTIGFYGLNSIREQGFGTCRISNIQCEEGYDITEYTPYIDPATVTVARCGKNILNPNRGSSSGKGLTFTNNGDGSFTVKGTATAAASFGLTNLSANPMYLHKGITYTQSVIVLAGSMNGVAVVPSVEDGDGNVTWNYFSNNQTKTPEKNYKFRGYEVYVENGKTVDVKFRVQLEVGATATDYELHKAITAHVPAADGTIPDLTSLSPNMTILPDTEGVIVECEYIRDTNKVIEKLTNAIIALGGSV